MCKNQCVPDDEYDLGRLLSAAEAQRLLGIKAGTVRSWALRRHRTGLYSGGVDNRGAPVYWEADLLAIASKQRLRDYSGNRLIFGMPVTA